MRKIMCILLTGLLLGLWGCGSGTAPANGEKASTADQTTLASQPEPQPEKNATDNCEIILQGIAKTSTHYYTPSHGGILRAAADNIAEQERLPLPDSYDGLPLAGAEICGITEDWLFINLWEARETQREIERSGDEEIEVVWEDYENRNVVTFRIALESWEAEALLAETYNGERPLPWYHPAGNALLIPQVKKEEVFVDVMSLHTRTRTGVLLDGKPLSFRHWNSWWKTTQDGQAALVECVGDSEEGSNFYVFDAQNQVQLKQHDDLNFAKRWTDAPQNEMEKTLLSTPESEGRIWTVATVGELVYYVQYTPEWTQANVYRINTDGSGRKLLRENTNILELASVGGKLFAHAYNPSVSRYSDAHDEAIKEVGIYLLDKEGKHAQTLLRYWDDLEGNSGYGFYGYDDLLVVSHGAIYSPSEFSFLYDPATGAVFSGEETLSWDESSEEYYCPC